MLNHDPNKRINITDMYSIWNQLMIEYWRNAITNAVEHKTPSMTGRIRELIEKSKKKQPLATWSQMYDLLNANIYTVLGVNDRKIIFGLLSMAKSL